MSAHEGLHLGWRRRPPMMLQTEVAECGLASIAMIASYLGYETNLVDLRRRFGQSLKGATLKELVRIADQLGLAPRPLRLEMEELGQLRLPCILHWDLNHFVVLVSVTRGATVIHDPAVGIRQLSAAEVARHFTGVALELYPTDRFEPASAPPRVRLHRLLGRMVGVKRALVQLSGMSLALEVFAIAGPLFLGWVVDHALVTGDRDLLLTLVLAFGLLMLLQTAVAAMRSWMLMGQSATLAVQSRANLFSHLVSLPAGFFEARDLGDVTSRFGSQEAILQAITTQLVEALMDGLMAAITLTIMLIFAPDLAGVVVAGAVLYGLLRWAAYAPLRQAYAESIVLNARLETHLLETLRGIRTIKLFNGQEERRTRWLNLLVQTTNRYLTTERLQVLFRTFNALLFGIMKILIIWLGARRVLDNTFSVGLLLAFLAYKDQFLDRATQLINTGIDLRMLRLHAERLADIALAEPETRGGWSPDVDERPPVAIELRNASFRYGENEPWVLKDLNLRIDAGEAVAIVGPSGSGKSTLLKLLSGLVQPTQGEILVNGEPLPRLGLEHYRAILGVVIQDDQLFAGSIADNICFFSEQPDQDRIRHCAELAAVHDDILAMPMGYSTLIGDMGTVLSGGQKQRVLIARALYRKPSILLLDEATSHLDVDRERLVNAALAKLPLTRIVIAHRPETIRMSGRVVMLKNGELIQPAERTHGMDPQLGKGDHVGKLKDYARDVGDRGAELLQTGGELALQEPSRRNQLVTNRTVLEIEEMVVELSLAQPAFGQVRIANEIRRRGHSISPAGVRRVRQRHGLETMRKRLDVLEAKAAAGTPAPDNDSKWSDAEPEIRLPKATFDLRPMSVQARNQNAEDHPSNDKPAHPVAARDQSAAPSGHRPGTSKGRFNVWGRAAVALSTYFLTASICI